MVFLPSHIYNTEQQSVTVASDMAALNAIRQRNIDHYCLIVISISRWIIRDTFLWRVTSFYSNITWTIGDDCPKYYQNSSAEISFAHTSYGVLQFAVHIHWLYNATLISVWDSNKTNYLILIKTILSSSWKSPTLTSLQICIWSHSVAYIT